MLKYMWIIGVGLGITAMVVCFCFNKTIPIIAGICAAIPTLIVLVTGIIVFYGRKPKKDNNIKAIEMLYKNKKLTKKQYEKLLRSIKDHENK